MRCSKGTKKTRINVRGYFLEVWTGAEMFKKHFSRSDRPHATAHKQLVESFRRKDAGQWQINLPTMSLVLTECNPDLGGGNVARLFILFYFILLYFNFPVRQITRIWPKCS